MNSQARKQFVSLTNCDSTPTTIEPAEPYPTRNTLKSEYVTRVPSTSHTGIRWREHHRFPNFFNRNNNNSEPTVAVTSCPTRP